MCVCVFSCRSPDGASICIRCGDPAEATDLFCGPLCHWGRWKCRSCLGCHIGVVCLGTKAACQAAAAKEQDGRQATTDDKTMAAIVACEATTNETAMKAMEAVAAACDATTKEIAMKAIEACRLANEKAMEARRKANEKAMDECRDANLKAMATRLKLNEKDMDDCRAVNEKAMEKCRKYYEQKDKAAHQAMEDWWKSAESNYAKAKAKLAAAAAAASDRFVVDFFFLSLLALIQIFCCCSFV